MSGYSTQRVAFCPATVFASSERGPASSFHDPVAFFLFMMLSSCVFLQDLIEMSNSEFRATTSPLIASTASTVEQQPLLANSPEDQDEPLIDFATLGAPVEEVRSYTA